MEHRWGHRHEVSEQVRVRARGGQWVRGCISNASISGAFIVTRLSAAPLSHLSVRFSRSRGSHTEELEGQVVRSTRKGLAIEWTEFAPTRVRTLMLIPASGRSGGYRNRQKPLPDAPRDEAALD